MLKIISVIKKISFKFLIFLFTVTLVANVDHVSYACTLVLVPKSVGTYNNTWTFQRLVGGVSLDKSAVFLEDMTDITGAYYDNSTNRVVLVGPKRGTSQTPVFNKDDFAVAVKSVVFNNTLPQVNIGDPYNVAAANYPVQFYGGLENTNFGNVIEKADYSLKKLMLGIEPNGQPVNPGVSGYSSFVDRFIGLNPGQPDAIPAAGRIWISPQTMTLKRDTSSNSFVFSQTTMQVQNEVYQGSQKYKDAMNGLTQHLTSNYDAYSANNIWLAKTKDLSKIVSVVKWLKDNNIVTDYAWAKSYQPAFVQTATSEPRATRGPITSGGYNWTFYGGVVFDSPNGYVSDNGQSSSLKSASENAAPSKESLSWTFTQSGQTYSTMAVAANAFESLGGYGTRVKDVSIDTKGDNELKYERSYSSLSTIQQTTGRGWDNYPARIISNQPWNVVSCSPAGGYAGDYPKRLTFINDEGAYETFTYDCPSASYLPDKSSYHSKILRNIDGSYTVRLKSQVTFKFSSPGLALLSRADKNGNNIHYQYGSGTKITKIEDDYNHFLTLNYNATGLVSSVVDWNGRTTSYGYDSQGYLTTVTDPRNHTTTYTYDTDGRLATITNRNGQQVLSNTYNSAGKMITSTSASGVSTGFSYDETNKVITATEAGSRTTKTYYDDIARVIKKRDALNYEVVYTYGNELEPLTVKDGRNNITTFAYDPNGNVTSITYPNNKVISFTYNSQNFMTNVSDGRYGLIPKTTTKTYDGKGNLLSVNEAGLTKSYTYDSVGMVTKETNSRGFDTYYQYNDFGNKVLVTDPKGAQTTFVYDVYGRISQIKDAMNKTKTLNYDANDNLLTSSDSVGTTTNSYNNEDKLLSTTTPDNKTTSYTYNSSGNQTGTVDAMSHGTNYGYDNYQNLISTQDALNHVTSSVYDKLNRKTESATPLGKVKKWSYDANGNIVQRTDESNRVTSYSYNSMNLLSGITYPDLSTVAYAYDDRANTTSMSGAAGTTAYTYDNFDRVTSITDPNNNTVSYTYDAANNVTSITYPGNKTVAYNYDAANQIKSVADWNNSKAYVNYGPNGLLQSKQLPNGIQVDYSYDNSNRLSSLKYSNEQSLITKFGYARDNRGNITSETESKPAAVTNFTIFGDTLATNWSTAWSWSSTINTADTANAYVGSKNISWQTSGAWAGLHIRNTSGTINTSPYSSISFALKSTQANQKIVLTMKDPNDNDMSAPVDVSMYGGHPSSSGYKVYTIPLTALYADSTLISGMVLQDNTGSAQPKMYIDEIKLTTATPNPVTFYDDTIAPEMNVWKWNGTENLNDTTQPFKGTKSLSLTASAGYSGIQLQHAGAGFTTRGSEFLRFALKGSQSNQDYTVQLTNSSGAGLAPELNIAKYAGRADASDYTVYTIPLTDLGASNVKTYGFILQNQNSVTQPKILTDEVKLIPNENMNVTNTQSTYTYDASDKLLNATLPTNTYAYAYDAAGNRISSNENGTSSVNIINNDDQTTSKSSRTFSFDNQGNRVSDGSKSLTFDFDNRLKTFSQTSNPTVNFKYDASGNRIGKNITGGTNYQFVNDLSGDLSKVLINKNVNTGSNNFYIHTQSPMSQGDSSSASRQYYLEDGMGNIRYLTNNTGANVQSYTYDPFGNPIIGSGGGYNFQGQEKDTETGLIYLRARYYDPSTGTFLSRDQYEGDLKTPITQNDYPYAGNNPINKSDPSGLWYINLNGSFGVRAINAGGGIIFSDSGIYSYGQGGVSLKPGAGISLTYSPAKPNPGLGGGISGFFILGGAWNFDGTWEVGVGTPGISINGGYTFDNQVSRGGSCR